MKKLITLLLLSFFVTVCGQVNANDYEKIFSRENVLIDVRTPSEYQAGHLKNAVNIPYERVKAEIEKLVPDKEQTIVLYCHSGKRAGAAERKLKEMGYSNVINAGKFNELKAAQEKLNPSNTGR